MFTFRLGQSSGFCEADQIFKSFRILPILHRVNLIKQEFSHLKFVLQLILLHNQLGFLAQLHFTRTAIPSFQTRCSECPLRKHFQRSTQMPVQQYFIFASCSLKFHFPLVPPNILRTSRWNGCSYKKSKAGWLAACLDQASCFCLVRAIKPNIDQLTWPLPMTRLGSLSAQRSRTCTMGLFLESSGSRAQLRCKQHFGVLEKIGFPSMIGVQRWAGLFVVVLGRLARGRTEPANLLPEGSHKLLSLSAFLS